jgi:hypothetical protein
MARIAPYLEYELKKLESYSSLFERITILSTGRSSLNDMPCCANSTTNWWIYKEVCLPREVATAAS